MAWLFGALVRRLPVLAWLGLGGALWLVRVAHYLRFRSRPQADEATLRGWRPSWMALVLAPGAMWAVAVWLFWGLGTP